jgi:hypothetical protein
MPGRSSGHNEGVTGDPDDELEREARRRAATEAVIPASRTFWRARRFGRRWLWVQAGVAVLIALLFVGLLVAGEWRAALVQVPNLLLSAAMFWFCRRVHYRDNPPSLRLTPEGLSVDALPRIGPIPWDEVEEIQAGRFCLMPVIRVRLRDPRSLSARLSRRDRRLLWLYRLPGRCIGLNAAPFGLTPADTAQRLRRYWLYGPATAESPVEQITRPATAQAAEAHPQPSVAAAPTPSPQVQTVGRRWWQD